MARRRRPPRARSVSIAFLAGAITAVVALRERRLRAAERAAGLR